MGANTSYTEKKKKKKRPIKAWNEEVRSNLIDCEAAKNLP